MRNYIIILMVILQSCQFKQPSKDDFFGKWRGGSSELIIFNEDGTVQLENFPGNIIFSGFREYHNKNYNLNGSWNLKNEKYKSIIELKFGQSESLKKGFYTTLFIEGSGLFNQKPPWKLYFSSEEWENERYYLKKI